MRAEARSGLFLSTPYTAFLLLFALFPIAFSVALVGMEWQGKPEGTSLAFY